MKMGMDMAYGKKAMKKTGKKKMAKGKMKKGMK